MNSFGRRLPPSVSRKLSASMYMRRVIASGDIAKSVVSINRMAQLSPAACSKFSMTMGAPDGEQELVTRRVSSSAGRPPTWCWAATARFFLMVALLAVGCALLVASYAPRPATAVWVGG